MARAQAEERYDFATLPDLLRPGLRLVLVGINPSLLSVEQGHYFARKSNRFWPAFTRSRLSAPARAALGLETLGPEHDVSLPACGIGFTDVVKRPGNEASALKPADFQEWAPRLVRRLERYRPLVACFHGLMAYRPFVKYGLGQDDAPVKEARLGPQSPRPGGAHLFVVPNPSPANAHFTPAEQAAWYDRLADYLAGLEEAG